MARIEPLPRDIHSEFAEIFDHYEATRGFIPNSILTMQRRPGIAEAFMALNKAVLYEGTVPEETKMLVSLISSQATGCRYCQAHMSNLSAIYEASAEKIAGVWEWESSDLFSPAEKAALTLAYNASLVPNQATENHFAELGKYFDDDQVVEIVGTIALFGYLNRWNDTMATELEEFAAKRAETLLSTVGWDAGKHAS